MNSYQVREYLESFINREFHLTKSKSSEFSLNNIKRLLSLVGNPQEKLKIIHVAGSKGKGSTCAVIASILQCAGYRTGLYTSPHLEDVTERIRILGDKKGKGVFVDAISEESFCKNIEELKPFIEKVKGLSYFEILTATAFFYFAKQKVDFVVLETGLGGRLDATNVGLAKVSAITSIGLEHVHILGDTLEKIAYEKIGIIKSSQQKVVVAPQESLVESVILKHCQEVGVQVRWIGKDIEYGCFSRQAARSQCLFINGKWAMYKNLKTSLLGEYQLINIALAVGVVEALKDLGEKISLGAVEKGVAEVHFPGRFEIVKNNPIVVLDCAHTPDSAKGLVSTFQSNFPNKKAVLILGVSDDKDKVAIGREVNKITDKVIVTKANHLRAGSFQESELKDIFGDKKCYKTNNVKEAMDFVMKEVGIVLITGSIFVVSEARKICINTMV